MESKFENEDRIEIVKMEEGLGYGSSLAVPSVQEIVRNEPMNVPERYVRETKERPLISSQILPLSARIPIINLSRLANGDDHERLKLHIACKEWGFFQLIGHGIPKEVLCGMKEAVEAFFRLPLTEKKKYAMMVNDLQGYGQSYVVSGEQKLDWNDLIFLMVSPISTRNMKYWPTALQGFKEAVEDYSSYIVNVTNEIFGHLSILMGMKREGLKELHGEIMKHGMRMNYYPTCSKPELVLGVSPHSDASSITLLLQDDDITGLQVRHMDVWVPVEPLANALVVNIGDALEGWSNGVYKSVEHRAVTNSEKSRISVANFVIPDNEVDIGPVETMVNEKCKPKLYKNMKYIEYLRYTLAREMDGKSNLEYLRLDV
ncbi:protein SRG1-like [Impatiens glandulifera]|uniref:protein SRG1-like n=1 Tax=Impatiens glandulifera TaxID=253017 RepID=UPI001FB14409|nr:protein SRG1-like [Impatiens glandulifera]